MLTDNIKVTVGLILAFLIMPLMIIEVPSGDEFIWWRVATLLSIAIEWLICRQIAKIYSREDNLPGQIRLIFLLCFGID